MPELNPHGPRPAAPTPQPSPVERFVIVTGAGRSGTSAVARVLHESALPMGSDFGPPSAFNPAGFYEELSVRALNQRIMEDCGILRLEDWPARSVVLARAAAYRASMEDLVASTRSCGWKDPRFCLTLEAWLPHFRLPPKVVVCLRSPEAFAQSAVSIFGPAPRARLERWWVNHYRRVLDIIESYGLPATCVVYEDLVRRPQETVAGLASFVGCRLDVKYVEPSLQHFAHRVPRRHAALYDHVRALARRRFPR